MQLKAYGVVLSLGLLSSSAALAGAMGNTPNNGFRPLISVYSGATFNRINAKDSLAFTGSDDDVFTYNGVNNTRATILAGVFLGVQHPSPYQGLFFETGIEYAYFGNGLTKGLNSVGIEPATADFYNYSWNNQTQLVLAATKLSTTTHLSFINNNEVYPYLYLGLGAAFNNAKHYTARPISSGSLNVTPTFNDHRTTSFSYSLGLGVDTAIDSHMRLGLGYRFSDLGKASLGAGRLL